MTRYDFGAIAEVIDLRSRDDVIAVTRDLSLSGCFVKTRTPFSPGTEVRIRMRCAGSDFAAIGTVTENITWEGMGIEFVDIEPKDQATLEAWLNITAAENVDARGAASASAGQQTRLKNRLSRREKKVRAPSEAAEPKAQRNNLLATGLLESARNFWKFSDETQ